MMMNTKWTTNLVEDPEFIQFDNFNIAQYDMELTELLKKAQKAVAKLEIQQAQSFWDMFSELHLSLFKLNRTYNILEHLLSVKNSDELRLLHDKFQPIITDFYVDLGQNENLFKHYSNIKRNEYKKLDPEQQKVVDNELRNFELSGINLTKEQRLKFKQFELSLANFSTKFEQNVLDATDNYVKYVAENELSGIPNDLLQMYKAQAEQDGKNRLCKITLHVPSYLPIMQYCSNRSLRKELYYHYVIRASELGDNQQWDNTEIIKKILDLRHNKATILNFNNYTELSLYTKMAKNSNQILDFLYQLADKSKSQANKDIVELTNFAKTTEQIDKLEIWDVIYFSEKLQQEKYNYSNNELKQYFPHQIVLNGLFELIKQLYNVEFKLNQDIPTWNLDVLTYDLIKDGEIIANLFLDLFAKKGKRPGAWMNSAQDKYKHSESIQYKPTAYIICNFTPPISQDKQSLLTFDDVQTLFHEMGHALHHTLTKINHFAISGINGVEWDAVELPSQFMEYFTWDYDILQTISKHIDLNVPLPRDLYNKILSARFFQSGLQMLRQIEFAVFDILLHNQNKAMGNSYLQILDQVRSKIALIKIPEYNRFPNSFSHIFAGGYASGYYSYKWAELLATDVFSIFENKPIESYGKLGARFLESVLSRGGLKPMHENFKEFMGRDPEINALLRHSGINKT